MINTRSDIYDILTDYLKTEYELIYMFYSGDDGMWSNHKVVQYANGVVLGKYREKDICTMNVLKKGVSDKALVDEIKCSIAYEDKLYRAKEKPDIMDKAHNETNKKLSRELLEFSIDEWIHRNCKWIKEDTFDISDQEERVLLFLYYAFRNFSNERKNPYCNELDQIKKSYKKIMDKHSQFYKYGLLPIDADRELLAVDPPRIYDKSINKTFFTKNIPLNLLQQLSKMISEGLIGELSVRLLNEPGYDGRMFSEYISEALERGKVFELADLGKYQVSKLYSETYEDCMWVNIDPKNITFEELCENFETYDNTVVTQVIHLQYEKCEEACYITHLDHEYIFYTIDEYEQRIKNVFQKGTARSRMKSFKIDNARIPFDTIIKIILKDEKGADYKTIYVQWLCYVLESYFRHKDLLVEYFQNL